MGEGEKEIYGREGNKAKRSERGGKGTDLGKDEIREGKVAKRRKGKEYKGIEIYQVVQGNNSSNGLLIPSRLQFYTSTQFNKQQFLSLT